MASSSHPQDEEFTASTSTFGGSIMPVKELPYAVFINHGPDVKHTLASAMYEKLNANGLKVFMNSEELELGDQELEAAIKSPSLYFAIFSEDYAQSRRCLEELSFMHRRGTTIVPIFYHVKPEDVRYAKGVYAEYEKKGKHTSEKLPEWNEALYSVSHNIGHIVNSKEDEDMLLKKIADCKEGKMLPFLVEEFAPANSSSSIQLASSTSTSLRKRPYDVFINHRGPDVKRTLAIAIYKVLTAMGLRVFLDSEELRWGDHLPSVLEEVMKSASLHLAILSENYAQSKWCLRELAFMLQTGTRIVPCFYNVKPEDVRNDEGIYAAAFERHEGKGRHTLETVQKWRDALYSVSHNTGHVLNKDEAMLLKTIAFCVAKEFKKLVTEHPVGLDEIVMDFERTTLQSVERHGVEVVGILGMGGCGKTTLAKKLYDNKYPSFEKSSFILNVRDAASKGLLYEKQIELLDNLGFGSVAVNNIEEGKAILSIRLRSVRAFIVLDDVDRVDQLDALLPNRGSLGSESLIVITSRDFSVFKSWGISFVYKMKTLDLFHASQLFCWHAFLQPSPKKGFEKLVEKFLKVSFGLPLSLKVLGGQLYGNFSKDHWENQLRKLSRILPKDIELKLKISYDDLDNEEKEAFLDTACFFIGEESNLAIEVWNGLGWNGLDTWQKLVNKCFVETDERNRIRMHDHFRDLGRQIANKQSPYRLWSHNQIIEVRNEEQKEIGIRGVIATIGVAAINYGMRRLVIAHGTRKLKVQTSRGIWTLATSRLGLKIIVARGPNLNQVIKSSGDLVWLRWFDIGQGNLQSLISLKNLRVLELYEDWGNHHLRELWLDGCDPPSQLRVLVISECHEFQGFPKSIQHLKHLKKIILSSNQVKSLPEEFCCLESMEHLDLMGCDELSSLPEGMGNLRNLRHLDLTRCRKLGRLPDSFKDLMLLQHLDLEDCSNLTLRLEIMENMTKLEYLNFSNCEQLEELPRDITNQVSLRELSLNGMKKLREVPMKIDQLRKLRKLDIGSDCLRSLPASLGDLSSLTELSINSCPKLECLPDSVGRLNLLERLILITPGVKSRRLSVCQLINLKTLEIVTCPISELDLAGGSFSGASLCNLNRLYLRGTELSKISIPEDCCPGLETLTIEDNEHLTEIEVLPSTVSIVGLVNLQKLHIIHCRKLYALPNFAQLPSLREFELRGCYQVEEIQGLRHCRELKVLKAMRKSVVEGCIQSLQVWPRETIVCTQAVQNAASLVNSFASLVNPSPFPTLSVVDSCSNLKIDVSHSAELVWKQTTDADAIIVCFVINCVTPSMSLSIKEGRSGEVISETEVKGGKWVWIGVFTHWPTSDSYKIGVLDEGEGEVEKGLFVTGEEQSLVEEFRRLWGVIAI